MIKLYKLTDNNSVIRLADGACIPFAEGNRDYEGYKIWLSQGNIPQPAHTDEELLNTAKSDKLTQLYTAFSAERDAITWVTQANGTRYGYDRSPEDITNFIAARARAELGSETYYKVYLNDTSTKQMIVHTVAMFNACLEQSAQEQIAAYVTFATKKAEIEACTTIEELEQICPTQG